ncbi:MAG: DUF4214 domain-containing protein [Massilia sp.]
MASTYYENIQKLYVAYFNRPADVAGLTYWETAVEATKGDTTAVSAAFAGSAEYKAQFANMTNEQVVAKVYQNLFGHAPDAPGQKYWADLLTAKAFTVDQVVTQIAGGALTTDKVAYDSKVAFAGAFTAALDTDAEAAGYKGDAANAAAKALVAGITDAASLATAIVPATLNSSVANVVAAGTPFTVVGALATLEAAIDAKADFLAAVDGDDDASTIATEGDVAGEAAAAAAAVSAKIANSAAYDAGSAAVKAAMLADQMTVNATKLSTDQKALADANAAIAKVAGLSTAVATYTAAQTGTANAVKAQTTASADLAAKLASLPVLNATATTSFSVTIDPAGTGTATYTTVAGGVTTTKDLIVVTDGKLALATGVTETKFPGVTALLNSSIAHEAADANVAAAAKVEASALTNVNYLDQSATEVTDLTNIATSINASTTGIKVAAGAQATEAQMASQLAALTGTAKSDFQTLVNTYHTDALVNPLYAAVKPASDLVAADQKVISDLAKLVTAQKAADADVATLKALNDALAAATKVFVDHDLVTPVSLDVNAIATAASDIFVASNVDATITMFGSLGTDQLYIGSGYTVNTGALTTGNDAVLEAFIIQNGLDTQIKLEAHNFSSHVTTAAAPELVTITLTGVDATHVHLAANGIITVA